MNENERRDKCFSPKLYGFGRRSLKSEEGLVEKTWLYFILWERKREDPQVKV